MANEDTHVENGIEYHDSFFIDSKYVSILEGKMLTTVELLGLPTEQSEALKSTIRQHIWGGTMLKHGRFVESKKVPEVKRLISSYTETEQ